jgi:hypothetical protein
MIFWVDLRFCQWGRWVQMGRGLGSKGLSAAWGTVGGGNAKTSFVPIKSLEDSRTDDWVRAQEPQAQAILLQVYCTPATSIENARVLKMSLRTLYARLHTLQVAYTQRNAVRETAN